MIVFEDLCDFLSDYEDFGFDIKVVRFLIKENDKYERILKKINFYEDDYFILEKH